MSAGQQRMTQLIRRVTAVAGWTVERRRGGHLRFHGPDGQLVFAPHSPSGARTPNNVLAQLRRAGWRES